MTAKAILQRDKKIEAARSAVDVQGTEMVRALQEQLAETGLDGELPDAWVSGLQDVLTRHLEARGDVLGHIEDTKHLLLGQARELRARRHELRAELYDRMVRLRQTVKHVFGEAREREFFGTGKTARDPLTLTRVARALVTRLRRPGEADKISQEAGVSFDWDVKLQRLEEPLDALETVLGGLGRAEAGARKAVVEKQDAMKDLDRTQRGVFQVLEGLYRLAGLDGLAHRLRPTVPRRRSRAEPASSEDAASGSREAPTGAEAD